VGVAEEFLDGDQFDALFEEQGGAGVAQVVEAGSAESGVSEEGAEVLGDAPGSSGLSLGVVKTRFCSSHLSPAV
jgi:hypothetical protein